MCLYRYNCGIVGSRGRISNIEEGAQNYDGEDGVLGPSSSPAGGLEGHGCWGKKSHKNKKRVRRSGGEEGNSERIAFVPFLARRERLWFSCETDVGSLNGVCGEPNRYLAGYLFSSQS